MIIDLNACVRTLENILFFYFTYLSILVSLCVCVFMCDCRNRHRYWMENNGRQMHWFNLCFYVWLTTKRFSDYFSNLKLFNWADGIVIWMTKTFTNNALARDKNLNSLVRDSDAFVDYTDMTGLDLWSMMLAALQKITIMPIISRPLVYSSALTDRIRWLNLKKNTTFYTWLDDNNNSHQCDFHTITYTFYRVFFMWFSGANWNVFPDKLAN